MFSFAFMDSVLIYCMSFLIVLVLTIYAYFQYSYTYWARKGLPYLKPKFPLGNNDCIGKEALTYGTEVTTWYNELKQKGHKLGGAWSWAKPVVILTDPEYIKDVFVKDFQYFLDRDVYHNPKDDPRNENVFLINGEEWKNTRQKLTPTFTSAKMKMMFESVLKCSDSLVEAVETAAKTGDISIREILMSFTIDVIACIAFGLEAQSFSNKDSKFRTLASDVFKPSIFDSLSLIMGRISENFSRKLGIPTNPKYVTKFFVDIVTETIKYRRGNNIKRPDFIQLLMDLQENTKNDEKPFTFNEVVANAIVFYFAGFETSTVTMSMALYELGKNQKLQEKTRNEIREVIKKHNGHITYDAFQEMTYLRQVVDETLRLHSPVHATSRVAVKPYKFKNTDLTIEIGTPVILPIMGLARDPEYFPDPEKFDPDRFGAENRASLNSRVYLPFGEGPRNCVGMRFGIMQSSMGLIRILDNFKITISPSTKMPLTFKKGSFVLQTNETLFVNAEKIK